MSLWTKYVTRKPQFPTDRVKKEEPFDLSDCDEVGRYDGNGSFRVSLRVYDKEVDKDASNDDFRYERHYVILLEDPRDASKAGLVRSFAKEHRLDPDDTRVHRNGSLTLVDLGDYKPIETLKKLEKLAETLKPYNLELPVASLHGALVMHTAKPGAHFHAKLFRSGSVPDKVERPSSASSNFRGL